MQIILELVLRRKELTEIRKLLERVSTQTSVRITTRTGFRIKSNKTYLKIQKNMHLLVVILSRHGTQLDLPRRKLRIFIYTKKKDFTFL